MIKYWCEVCPVCREGYLFVYKREDTGVMYLHCEECESAFSEVGDVDKPDGGFRGEYIDSIVATWDDIRQTAWEAAVKGKIVSEGQ
jgi:hypothetical protein